MLVIFVNDMLIAWSLDIISGYPITSGHVYILKLFDLFFIILNEFLSV